MEINCQYFIDRIGKTLTEVNKKLTKEDVLVKFDYMNNRIGSAKAKEFAKPFYDKAILEVENLP